MPDILWNEFVAFMVQLAASIFLGWSWWGQLFHVVHSHETCRVN